MKTTPPAQADASDVIPLGDNQQALNALILEGAHPGSIDWLPRNQVWPLVNARPHRHLRPEAAVWDEGHEAGDQDVRAVNPDRPDYTRNPNRGEAPDGLG